EQVAVLRDGHRTCERLVEMVMSVYEAGKHHMPATQVEHFMRNLRQAGRWPNLLDHVVAHEYRRIPQLLSRLVHRHESVDVLYQQGAHGSLALAGQNDVEQQGAHATRRDA